MDNKTCLLRAVVGHLVFLLIAIWVVPDGSIALKIPILGNNSSSSIAVLSKSAYRVLYFTEQSWFGEHAYSHWLPRNTLLLGIAS